MNCDGLTLIERIEKGNDPHLLETIDRCYHFAKSKQEYETILRNVLAAKDKVYIEVVNMHLLSRILENL